MSLLVDRHFYKPFQYEWAYHAWSMQQKIHWLPEEVSLGEDVKDWQKRLLPNEKNLLTQIFRLFTQMDVEVGDAYMEEYMGIFGPPEIKMMLAAFANMETVHMDAYAYLLDTVGMAESEYSAFMEYAAMKQKYDFLQQFTCKNPDGTADKFGIAMTLAVFGAFTEGLQLFASFAILLNFPRFGKMKGMGQIITWSVRDETLHCISIIRLFHTFIEENHQDLDIEKLNTNIKQACIDVVNHEDAFIDLVFEMGNVEGLAAEDVKLYIRYIADRRLIELGLHPIFNIAKNPLPWLDIMLNGMEFVNFFENRVTEYTKAATQGSWEEAFAEFDEDKV